MSNITTNSLVKFLALFCCSGFFLWPLLSNAAFTKQINYQGKLTNAAGTAVSDSTYTIIFTLYDAPTGGNVIWTETDTVTTQGGLFSLMLGAVSSLDNVNFNQALYLALNVNGDGEMSPRKTLGSVASSFTSARLDGNASSTAIDVSGYLVVNGNLNAGSITLGGVTRTTWPSGGGGDGVWATTTSNVAYPDLADPYALVLGGSSTTTANSIFEVHGISALATTSLAYDSWIGSSLGTNSLQISSRYFTDTPLAGVSINYLNSQNEGAGGGLAVNDGLAVYGQEEDPILSLISSGSSDGAVMSYSSSSNVLFTSGFNSSGWQELDGAAVYANTFGILSSSEPTLNFIAGTSFGGISNAYISYSSSTNSMNFSQAWGGYRFDSSIAIGSTASSSGIPSLSMGDWATSSGSLSVAIGDYTLASGDYSFALGPNSQAIGRSSVAFGEQNQAVSSGSYIFGGSGNYADEGSLFGAIHSTSTGGGFVFGGNDNNSGGVNSAIVGGANNRISGDVGNGGIFAGVENMVTGYQSMVLGGNNNLASGNNSGIYSGHYNIASGTDAAILAGINNVSAGNYSVVLGGGFSTSSGANSAVLGGSHNVASGNHSLALDGSYNVVSGDFSYVLGGQNTTVSGSGSYSFGDRLTISGNNSFGYNLNPDYSYTISGNKIMAIMGGKVGIGTTSPSESLEILGNANIGGNTAAYKINGINLAYGSTTLQSYFLGDAGNFTTTGFSNLGFGSRSLQNNIDGAHNLGLGSNVLSSNNWGSWNVGVGDNALMSNIDGNYNTAVGKQVLENNISGSWNVGVGDGALISNITGIDNVAIGPGSLASNLSGTANTAIGQLAGLGSLGSRNLFLGVDADVMVASSTLYNSTAIGNSARVGGSNMMVLGGSSTDAVLVGIGTSTPNAFLDIYGSSTDSDLFRIATSTNQNILFVNRDGRIDVGNAINVLAGGSYRYNNADMIIASTTLNNYFFGEAGNLAMTGAGNVGVGYISLSSNTDGYLNTAVGLMSLAANTGGYDNTAIGGQTLTSNTTGFYNTAVGMGALSLNTTGGANTAVGVGALLNNSIGNSNNAFGYMALLDNTIGSSNIAIGQGALARNITGSQNVSIGEFSLEQNTLATGTVSIGYRSGNRDDNTTNHTGSYNTFIGYMAGPNRSSTTPIFNAIAIGKNSVVSASNTMSLGGLGDDAVKVGIGTSSAEAFLDIYGTSTDLANITSYGQKSTFNINPLSSSVLPQYGSYLTVSASSFSGVNLTGGVMGSAVYTNHYGAGNATSLYGLVGGINNYGSGSVTNSYGLYLASTTGAITNNYGIYQAGAGTTNYFAGNINMGAGSAYQYNGVNMAYGSTTLGNYFFGDAGNLTTTGNANTAVGSKALSSNLGAVFNSAFGSDALSHNTTGAVNVAVGSSALVNNISGSYNTAVGHGSLSANTTGQMNSAFGLGALSGGTTASYNVGIGDNALVYNNGSNNVALGFFAGRGGTPGDQTPNDYDSLHDSNMVFIGSSASRDGAVVASTTYLSNSIAIGAYAKVGGSNMMALGGMGGSAVKVGIGTSTPYRDLSVVGSGFFSGNVLANSFTLDGTTLSSWSAVPNGWSYSLATNVLTPATTTTGLAINGTSTLATTTMPFGSYIGNEASGYMTIEKYSLGVIPADLFGPGFPAESTENYIPMIKFSSPQFAINNAAGGFLDTLLIAQASETDSPNLVFAAKDVFAGVDTTMNGGVMTYATTSRSFIFSNLNSLPVELIVMGSTSISSLDSNGAVYSNEGTLTNINPSSVTYKEDIAPTNLNIDGLLNLQVKSFTWKKNGQTDYGLIAEEVKSVAPELYRDDGTTKGYRQDHLVFYLLQIAQRQEAELKALKSTLGTNGMSIGPDGSLAVKLLRVEDLIVENGVTIRDRSSGAYTCVYIENGNIKTSFGSCSNNSNSIPVVTTGADSGSSGEASSSPSVEGQVAGTSTEATDLGGETGYGLTTP